MTKKWILFDKNRNSYVLELDRCNWTLNGERLYTVSQMIQEAYEEDES